MTKKSLVVMDGVTTANPTDFQSFVAHVSKSGHGFVICIPMPLSRYMKLKRGNLLQVAIRYIPHEKAKKLYLNLPSTRTPITVVCPKCKQKGTLRAGNHPSVVHRKKHGFSKITYHTISRSKFPEFYHKIHEMEGLTLADKNSPETAVTDLPVCERNGNREGSSPPVNSRGGGKTELGDEKK